MENIRENIKTASIYLIAGLIFVVGGAVISNKLTQSTTPPTIQRPVVTCPSDFASYSNFVESSPGQVVKLIPSRKSMFVSGGEFVNSQVVLAKVESATSKVACGYLFVRAGTQSGALQKWEDVVINPNGFGGHLVPTSAISVNDGSKYSEYLYALNKIQYWPDHNRQAINTADWAALLNVSQAVPFTIALNTEDTSGFVDEVSIAYKCWNPTTGEENDGCKLEVTSSTDTKGTIE